MSCQPVRAAALAASAARPRAWCRPRPCAGSAAADRDLDQEDRLVLGALAADLAIDRQRQAACPAPIPAAASWAAAARDCGCPAARPTAARRAAPPPRSRHRGRSRPAALRACRPGWRWRRRRRRRDSRCRWSRRPIASAISARVCALTRAAWRRASWPSRSCGKRRSSRSAMASDSTRSPRNSSRSLPCGKAALRSGRRSSAAAMGQRLDSELGAREGVAEPAGQRRQIDVARRFSGSP